MQTDRAEQAMRDRIPLRAARRIMTHGDRQPEAVAHLGLSLVFPLPGATPVTAPSVSQHQKPVGVRGGCTALRGPPAGHGLYGTWGRISRRAHVHGAPIVEQGV